MYCNIDDLGFCDLGSRHVAPGTESCADCKMRYRDDDKIKEEEAGNKK